MIYNDCDGKCPGVLKPHWCCRGCGTARKDFYEQAPDNVKALWLGSSGFWDPNVGCRLSREQRPKECLEYNCSDQLFVMGSARWNDRWPIVIEELPKSGASREAFMAKAGDVWDSMQSRTVLSPDSSSSWDEAMKHADGPTVYVLHGMMGSGKSGWARKLCQGHPRARIVSADSFRKMLHGRYEYHAQMDDVITNSMRDAAAHLLHDGYDVVVDCGNLTRERRSVWFQLATAGGFKRVAIRLPKQDKGWHLRRRRSEPHWNTDWSKVYDDELAAMEPLDEAWDAVIDVSAKEVMAKKILILSASPIRDGHIDNLIAAKLRVLGHEVEVHPCLRGGREKVLSYQPNLCIVPPIRNPNSNDFVTELKRFGCAVVVRHTEPSCSWQDWKRMDEKCRMEILGGFRYPADLELVWSSDEADILNRFRPGAARAVPIGAVGLDIYFDEALKATFPTKVDFCRKYRFDPEKKTVLITSPWGFADSSPDLNTDDIANATFDAEGRDRHLAMTRAVATALKDEWNVLMSIHHGVDPAPYIALAQELKVFLDAKSPMLDMLPCVDAVVHAGSTAAISAHLLGVAAFQYGDVNAKGGTNWWGAGESSISRVSPRYEDVQGLIEAIRGHAGGSNANLDTIKELEEGRYGIIDGKATERAVAYIDRLGGRFQYRWPRSTSNYDQLTIFKDPDRVIQQMACNVCGEPFGMLTQEYAEMLTKHLGVPVEKIRPPGSICCPHCAARMFQVQK